jgi:hypothetical protein
VKRENHGEVLPRASVSTKMLWPAPRKVVTVTPQHPRTHPTIEGRVRVPFLAKTPGGHLPNFYFDFIGSRFWMLNLLMHARTEGASRLSS